MSRPRAIQVVCILLMGVALVLAGQFQRPIDATHVAMDEFSGRAMTGDFPELRILQAMPGGMRALAIDYLWIRSESLKQKGKIYDAVQLADMICMLQPRFPGVWDYHAWNMAYNISVMTHTPEERWHWVSAGIKLLRDKGLLYNPKSLDLYRNLSWTYFNKVGGRIDDMQMYYKQCHAAEFHRLLGAPPKIGGKQENAAWLRTVVDAPRVLDDLLADDEAAQYVEELADCDLRLSLGLLDAYNRWSNDHLVKIIGQPKPVAETDEQKRLQELMTAPARAGARSAVLAFVRRKVLTERYRMDPAWMLEVVNRYGPVDWRLAQTHGLYWSSYGLYHCKGIDLKSINALNTDRNILNSLKELTFYGRIGLTYNSDEPSLPRLSNMPDWRFGDVCHETHVAMKEFITDQDDGTTYKSFINGHLNFLVDLIQGLVFAGRVERAEQFLQYVRDSYKPKDPKWELAAEPFVILTINRKGMPRQASMKLLIGGAIRRAFEAGLMDYQEDYELAMRRAGWLWKRYDQETPSPRLKLPSLNVMQAIIAADVMVRQLPVVDSITLWNLLSVDVQQQCYDVIGKPMQERCARVKIAFTKAFPIPPGMDEFRKRRAKAMQKRPK